MLGERKRRRKEEKGKEGWGKRRGVWRKLREVKFRHKLCVWGDRFINMLPSKA